MQVCDIDFNSSRNTTIQCLLGLMLTQNKKQLPGHMQDYFLEKVLA